VECTCRFPSTKTAVAAAAAADAVNEDEDEDDFELFGSDEDVDEAAEKLKQERLSAYEAKKAASECDG